MVQPPTRYLWNIEFTLHLHWIQILQILNTLRREKSLHIFVSSNKIPSGSPFCGHPNSKYPLDVEHETWKKWCWTRRWTKLGNHDFQFWFVKFQEVTLIVWIIFASYQRTWAPNFNKNLWGETFQLRFWTSHKPSRMDGRWNPPGEDESNFAIYSNSPIIMVQWKMAGY